MTKWCTSVGFVGQDAAAMTDPKQVPAIDITICRSRWLGRDSRSEVEVLVLLTKSWGRIRWIKEFVRCSVKWLD